MAELILGWIVSIYLAYIFGCIRAYKFTQEYQESALRAQNKAIEAQARYEVMIKALNK